MATRTLLDHRGDVLSEIITEDSDPNTVTIRTAQDLTNLVEGSKIQREEHHVIGHRKSRNLTPVMNIPLSVVNRAMLEGWFHDKAAWRRYINDPDNKHLRITQGKF